MHHAGTGDATVLERGISKPENLERQNPNAKPLSRDQAMLLYVNGMMVGCGHAERGPVPQSPIPKP